MVVSQIAVTMATRRIFAVFLLKRRVVFSIIFPHRLYERERQTTGRGGVEGKRGRSREKGRRRECVCVCVYVCAEGNIFLAVTELFYTLSTE